MLLKEMTLYGIQHVDTDLVKSYAADLRSLLSEEDITQSKAFLRSFIQKIVIDDDKATIHYKLPVPAHWPEYEEVGVLPIVPPSGEGGTRTPTPFEHMILSHARLPVPALPHIAKLDTDSIPRKINQFHTTRVPIGT
jgi:hypothetical protein